MRYIFNVVFNKDDFSADVVYCDDIKAAYRDKQLYFNDTEVYVCDIEFEYRNLIMIELIELILYDFGKLVKSNDHVFRLNFDTYEPK